MAGVTADHPDFVGAIEYARTAVGEVDVNLALAVVRFMDAAPRGKGWFEQALAKALEHVPAEDLFVWAACRAVAGKFFNLRKARRPRTTHRRAPPRRTIAARDLPVHGKPTGSHVVIEAYDGVYAEFTAYKTPEQRLKWGDIGDGLVYDRGGKSASIADTKHWRRVKQKALAIMNERRGFKRAA